MRTTVTLDSDVEALVRKVMAERHLSFKEVLNSAVRASLGGVARPKRFVQATFSMGGEQNFRWDKALLAADALEDEERLRKLAVRS